MTTSRGCSKPNSLIPTERNIAKMQILQTKGVHTLTIFLPKKPNLNVGQLGSNDFAKGYSTYTGSAMGRRSAISKLAFHAT